MNDIYSYASIPYGNISFPVERLVLMVSEYVRPEIMDKTF